MTDFAATANGATITTTGGTWTNADQVADGNLDTAANAPTVASSIISTFAQAVSLSKFRFKFGWPTSLTYTCEYYDDDDASYHTLGTGSATGVQDLSYTFAEAATLLNISKIRLQVEPLVSSWFGKIPVYEIQAWGNYYQDKGLRVRQTGGLTKKIAVETLSDDHQLRVSINGTVWGVPLVATTHLKASPVRIYDGSAVKALVDIT